MTPQALSGGVYLVAAEASGDALGADLVLALRARAPQTPIMGVGGAMLAAVGVASDVDLSGLAVLGLVDGLRAYPRVVKAADAVCADIVAKRPAVVVLIDSWGFMLRVAQRVRAQAPGIRLVKYIGPQVWATRPGRAKTLAATVDHLICIYDVEPAYYAPFGLACTVCGHPAIGRHQPGNGEAFRARYGLGTQTRLLGLAPGSRSSELRMTAPVIWGAARSLIQARPDLRAFCVAAPSVREGVLEQARTCGFEVLVVEDPSERNDAFAAATAIIATSGTVSTEIALQQTPVVVGYRLGWVTWALARFFLFKSPYASLVNVAAQAEVIPEFIQTRCTQENLTTAAARLLDDPAARACQIKAQCLALAAMGEGGPAAQDVAAGVVMEQLAMGARSPR